MKRVAAAFCVIALMGASMPAMAKVDSQDEPDLDLQEKLENAGESLKESLTTLMNLIEKVVSGVPQYEAPEILDNGDIIIRRKPPEDGESDQSEEHVQT